SEAAISALKISTHSLQANRPASLSRTTMAKARASHGAEKTGPSRSRGWKGICLGFSVMALAPPPRLASGEVQVVIPEVKVQRVPGGRVGAPEFARPEADEVDMLRFRVAVGVGIRQRIDPVVADDDAGFTAGIAWQTR